MMGTFEYTVKEGEITWRGAEKLLRASCKISKREAREERFRLEWEAATTGTVTREIGGGAKMWVRHYEGRGVMGIAY